jgi:hypothetical protein
MEPILKKDTTFTIMPDEKVRSPTFNEPFIEGLESAIKHFSMSLENEEMTLRSFVKSDQTPEHIRNQSPYYSQGGDHLYQKHQQLLKQSKTLPPSPKFQQESRVAHWKHQL